MTWRHGFCRGPLSGYIFGPRDGVLVFLCGSCLSVLGVCLHTLDFSVKCSMWLAACGTGIYDTFFGGVVRYRGVSGCRYWVSGYYLCCMRILCIFMASSRGSTRYRRVERFLLLLVCLPSGDVRCDFQR